MFDSSGYCGWRRDPGGEGLRLHKTKCCFVKSCDWSIRACSAGALWASRGFLESASRSTILRKDEREQVLGVVRHHSGLRLQIIRRSARTEESELRCQRSSSAPGAPLTPKWREIT